MISQRSVWIAARARNAARRGVWIAAFGGVAVIATLLVLIAVPREADRQLRRQIAALPTAPDSLPMVRRLDSLRAVQTAVRTRLNRVLAADSSATDSLADLSIRLRRVQQVPLAEGYRMLAESPVLRADPRVVALIDSIEVVEREREAHAALGGPGARYAALTARVAVLGQGLVRLAEQRLVNTVYARDSAGTYEAGVAADSTRLDAITRAMTVEESRLADARRRIAVYDTQRVQLEQRLNVASPPIAMLLAALVVGMAVGYGIVLARELRHPTVGDAAEVERMTGATVLHHARDTPSTLADRSRWRERPGVPRIIDRDSDSFSLLHLSLTGVGDLVPEVDILSDIPLLGAAVALGTAAAAARESRAVLVVEAARRQPLLAHVLQAKTRHTVDDVREGRVSADDAIHVVTLDRDAHIDVLVAVAAVMPATGLFRRRRRPVVPAVKPSVRVTPVALGGREAQGARPPEDPLRQFETRYDLRLHLPDAEHDGLAPARDVIICVRQGSTPLAWLSRVVQHTRARQQRLRVAVLWSRDLPPV
jgi:hypothetical protein